MSLALVNRRLPLLAPRKLSTALRAQLSLLLEQEGAGSITVASKDEEWRDSLELVDVRDEAGETLYQLWLWPSGSAVMFRANTTEIVADGVQHGLAIADAELRLAMKAALAGAAALGVRERLAVEAPAQGAAWAEAPEVAGGGRPDFTARLAAMARIADRLQRNAAAERLVAEQFGKPWNPYPKRAPGELTAEQRRLFEVVTDDREGLPIASDLHHYGLVSRADRAARYLGRTTGPADVGLRLGDRTVPLWIAVTNVGSGDLAPEPVMAAFQALPKDLALAAWGELVRGDVGDLDLVHPRSLAEADIPRTPANVKHRTRLFAWLADACVWLGESARSECERVLAELPAFGWGHRAFAATLGLSRWAKAHKAALDPRWDEVVRRLHGPRVGVYATPLLREIVRGLPKDRRAAVDAGGE